MESFTVACPSMNNGKRHRANVKLVGFIIFSWLVQFSSTESSIRLWLCCGEKSEIFRSRYQTKLKVMIFNLNISEAKRIIAAVGVSHKFLSTIIFNCSFFTYFTYVIIGHYFFNQIVFYIVPFADV